jgi:hypothetical protein
MSKEQIKKLMKENPKTWEGGGINSNIMCLCGHEEKYHHNHKDHAWGTYSWCRRCMMCDWYGANSCYSFTPIEKGGIIDNGMLNVSHKNQENTDNYSKDNAIILLDKHIKLFKETLILRLKNNKVPIRKYMGFNNDLFQFKQIVKLNIKIGKNDFINLIINNKKDLLKSEILRIKLYDDKVFNNTNIDEIIYYVNLYNEIFKKIKSGDQNNKKNRS